MRKNTAPLRKAVKVKLRGGGSLLASFKYHWWELELECGHTVERNIKWKPIPDAPRGWAALHHAPSLSRLPEEPKSARCEFCRVQALTGEKS